VNINYAESFKVETVTDTAIWEYVDLSVQNGTLKIGFKQAVSIMGDCTLIANVYLPVLESVKLSGASIGTIKPFSGQTLQLTAEGASNFYVDSLNFSNLGINFSGASGMRATSLQAQACSVELSGASEMSVNSANISNLALRLTGASTLSSSKGTSTCDNLTVQISSASMASFDAKITASGAVYSASTLYIGGSASSISINKDLSSNIIRR
jgi:hypothetical protein